MKKFEVRRRAQIAFVLKQAEEVTPRRLRRCAARPGSAKRRSHNWRHKYGGLLPSEMKRLRQLEEENGRLKRIVADLSLDKEMSRTCCQKTVRPARKRELVDQVRQIGRRRSGELVRRSD